MSETVLALKGVKGTIPADLVFPPKDPTPWSASNFITPGGGEVLDPADPDGKAQIPDPFDLKVDVNGLGIAQETLIATAQTLLGKISDGKPAYVFGGEGAQHGGKPLPKLLIDAGNEGFSVMQPSGNHIDLARCATDASYAAWVLAVHKAANIPLLSVSVHMDAYFLMSAVHNKRARAISGADDKLSFRPSCCIAWQRSSSAQRGSASKCCISFGVNRGKSPRTVGHSTNRTVRMSQGCDNGL